MGRGGTPPNLDDDDDCADHSDINFDNWLGYGGCLFSHWGNYDEKTTKKITQIFDRIYTYNQQLKASLVDILKQA